MVCGGNEGGVGSGLDLRLASESSHHLEKAHRISDGMNLANLVSVDRADGNGSDFSTEARGDDKHLGFVIELIGFDGDQALKKVATNQPETALGVADFLSADATDLRGHRLIG